VNAPIKRHHEPIEPAPGAAKQPTEIVDELVGTDPTAAARKQAGTFGAVLAGARRRLAEREAVARHVLGRSGRGSTAAALAGIEAEVKIARAIGAPAGNAQAEAPRPRGGVPGARLEPRRRRSAKVGLAAVIGRDVSIVTAGGGHHRGELLHAGDDWLTLERHSRGLLLIRTTGVVAITEELAEVPR